MGVARLRRVATGRVVLSAASVFVAFSVVLFNFGPVPAVVEAAGAPLLDSRFAWTQEGAQSFLSALREEGRRLYGFVVALDAAYGVTFAAGALLLAWISAQMLSSANALRWVALLPILAGALDLFENAGIAVLLSTFPSVPSMLAATLGLATAAKLVLGLGYVIALSRHRTGITR